MQINIKNNVSITAPTPTYLHRGMYVRALYMWGEVGGSRMQQSLYQQYMHRLTSVIQYGQTEQSKVLQNHEDKYSCMYAYIYKEVSTQMHNKISICTITNQINNFKYDENSTTYTSPPPTHLYAERTSSPVGPVIQYSLSSPPPISLL